MKKFKNLFVLILIAIVSITFGGCGNNNSTTTRTLEANIKNLSSVLKTIKDVNEDDIVIKDIYNSKNNSNKTEKVSRKIKEMPKQKAVTQVVRNNNLSVSNENDESAGNKITAYSTWTLAPQKSNKITAYSTWTLAPTKTANNKIEIEKAANRSISNSINLNNVNIKRLTTGTYTPRRINELEYNNESLTNYISKIEDLYLMMNDAVCANNDCNNLKNSIISNCDMLNLICGQLKKNEISLSDSQCESCNELLKNLNKNINTLNKNKNDVYNECGGVKKMNANSNANIDVASAKYVKLINCLDTRIATYSNILSILTQLRCTITGVCGSENLERANEIENSLKEKQIKDENTFETKNIENVNKINKNQEKNEKKADFLDEKVKKEQNKQILNENNSQKNVPQILEEDNTPIEKQNIVPIKNKSENLVDIVNKLKNEEMANISNEKIKRNIDTYKDETFKPNLDEKVYKNNNSKIKDKETDNKVMENKSEFVSSNTDEQTVNSNTTYPYNNGVYNPAYNGIYNTPVGGVYGNGMYGYGVHNFENGITNPYRNTDTYKLPTGIVRNPIINNGYAKISNCFTPLENEMRKDFKMFS